MWVKFVVGSFLCSERFFSRFSGFFNSGSPIRVLQFEIIVKPLWNSGSPIRVLQFDPDAGPP